MQISNVSKKSCQHISGGGIALLNINVTETQCKLKIIIEYVQ